MELKQIIAQNITELRKRERLTQAEFAQKLNYTDKAISKWERGESIPSVDILKQIADMFGVKVDFLLTEGTYEDKSELVLPKQNQRNQITITALGISIVWLIATILYVYSIIYLQTNNWKVFVWAVPVSCLVLSAFNWRWGKRIFSFYITSALCWSFLASVFLQLLKYTIWPIFIIGIPLQICIVLWSTLKPNPNRKKSDNHFPLDNVKEHPQKQTHTKYSED